MSFIGNQLQELENNSDEEIHELQEILKEQSELLRSMQEMNEILYRDSENLKEVEQNQEYSIQKVKEGNAELKTAYKHSSKSLKYIFGGIGSAIGSVLGSFSGIIGTGVGANVGALTGGSLGKLIEEENERKLDKDDFN